MKGQQEPTDLKGYSVGEYLTNIQKDYEESHAIYEEYDGKDYPMTQTLSEIIMQIKTIRQLLKKAIDEDIEVLHQMRLNGHITEYQRTIAKKHLLKIRKNLENDTSNSIKKEKTL